MPSPVPPRIESSPEERHVLSRVAEVSRQMSEVRALVRMLRQRNREFPPCIVEVDPSDVRDAD